MKDKPITLNKQRIMIVEQMLKNAQTPLLHIADDSGSALFQGDCLDIIPLIPDKSVNLILADLPYGTTQNKWDCLIPLEDYTILENGKQVQRTEFVDDMIKGGSNFKDATLLFNCIKKNGLWSEIWRVCKPNAAVVLFSVQPFTTKLISSQIKFHKYEWVWVKNLKTGNLNARKMPMGGHETIQVFYRKPPTYNPQKRQRTTEIPSGNKFNSKTTNYGKQREEYVDRQSDEISPDTALLNFKCVHNSSGKLHPTQKPVELCSYFIKTYTNEGETVLDMAMGSGTTCLAAKELNRKFIGIEKEPKYYEIACQRCGF